ncbi:hypothetical protein DZC71_01700 [Campylobacter hepaticus]|uniref:Hydrogenase-4 component G n=1 Tax=Campylobacter hepaticus TaxID=1813019 RepID=A0A424Z2Z3_9BACT|nr:hypothetical protein [Campylobacter hepaticus]RQD68692.1 hypothetical protein DZC71_01700 [Campylobacter hepaticus]RQD88647.1 hypothetical protein DZD40_00145 [Campylobacter hepaticus]
MQVNTFLHHTTTGQNFIDDKTKGNKGKIPFENLSTVDAKHITNSYLIEFQQQTMKIVTNISNVQNGIYHLANDFNLDTVKSILADIDFASLNYDGKNPLDMDINELEELISEEGFFGIKNTANRIADFVIQNSGDDIEKLKKGLEGIKQGFSEAEKMWGGALPKISQDTITMTLEKVNARIDELSTLDLKV